MAACSSQPSKPAPAETPQPKAPEAITGSAAFYKCYISARGWAPDVQPYRVESQPTTDSKGRDGKAGEWRVGFASPTLHTTRPYTWANGDISHSVEDSYSPTNSSTQIFNVQFLKVLDRANIRIEIWERGAGYTLASGSSSSAAAAAAHRLGLIDRNISVHMPGGVIKIEIGGDFSIRMTGPVAKVAEGVISPEIFG